MRRQLIFGCAALLCSAPLLAHEGHHKSMDEIDADKDGFITLAEAQANAPFLAERFQDVDADKDGQLSKDELKAMRATTHEKHNVRMEEKFKEADADGDSRLDRTEAAKMPFVGDHFADIDADGDGYVTREEVGKVKFKRLYREHKGREGDKPTGAT